MAERYNGWANYETWCVNLWLNNDEGTYDYWRDVAREVCEQVTAGKTFTAKEQAKIDLSDRLKDEITDGEFSPLSGEGLPGMYGDILRSALSEVLWGEIADAFLEDLDEYEALDKEETETE